MRPSEKRPRRALCLARLLGFGLTGTIFLVLFLSFWRLTICGVVAQLGERMTGSHEVRGSIPLSSTIPTKHLATVQVLFLLQ